MGWAERSNPESLRNLSSVDRRDAFSLFRVIRDRKKGQEAREKRDNKIHLMIRSRRLVKEKLNQQ